MENKEKISTDKRCKPKVITADLKPKVEAEAYELMMKGQSRKEVSLWIASKYGVDRTRGYQIVKDMFDEQQKEDVFDAENKRTQLEDMYFSLYKAALAEGNLKQAKAILDSVAKLGGLFVQKVESKTDVIEVKFG